MLVSAIKNAVLDGDAQRAEGYQRTLEKLLHDKRNWWLPPNHAWQATWVQEGGEWNGELSNVVGGGGAPAIGTVSGRSEGRFNGMV